MGRGVVYAERILKTRYSATKVSGRQSSIECNVKDFGYLQSLCNQFVFVIMQCIKTSYSSFLKCRESSEMTLFDILHYFVCLPIWNTMNDRYKTKWNMQYLRRNSYHIRSNIIQRATKNWHHFLYALTLSNINRLLPHCMKCRCGLAMRILSVRPSVSQMRGLWQNKRIICSDFYTVRKII